MDHLGRVAWFQGDYSSAHAYFEEELAIRRELGNVVAVVDSLRHLGSVAQSAGEHTAARGYFDEALLLCNGAGDGGGKCRAEILTHLGTLDVFQGHYASARMRLAESTALLHATGLSAPEVLSVLEAYASLAAAEGRPEWAARLLGSVNVVREQKGIPRDPPFVQTYQTFVATVRDSLGEPAFQSAWDQGAGFSLEQVVALADRAFSQ